MTRTSDGFFKALYGLEPDARPHRFKSLQGSGARNATALSTLADLQWLECVRPSRQANNGRPAPSARTAVRCRVTCNCPLQVQARAHAGPTAHKLASRV